MNQQEKSQPKDSTEELIKCPRCNNTNLNITTDTELNSMTLSCVNCGKFVTFGFGMYIRNIWKFNTSHTK